MKRSVHEISMEQAFGNSGGQRNRREIEQRREADVEQEEIEAARTWLAHVEAGRIGGGRIGDGQ